MLTDITIGQFFPGASALHRMDPRAKLVLLLVLMAAIFVFDTPGGYAVLAKDPSADVAQFTLSDGRPPAEVFAAIRANGQEVVFKNWDNRI